ncbi:sigma-70 family RNA polymerase sigma factor [Paraburkholderia susongensis]|uniref:DNA-directed RNA polymerase specialized sigma subunit, sigma24 family n=1 Tax=Paraburkholderia susongensis TaxID=1515439 RepID=A0A1X7ID13_9BURK|nr:sigma-70 family RNA polymerase sigma factor [Paraburkholderia susongensis]SMG12538.1 DNA-directed RNA polymerase specialized sigma subunit, sigma24 family [Paraburkholderia susongensis]
MDHGASTAIGQLLAHRERFHDFFMLLRKGFFRLARRRFPWARDFDIEESLHEALVAVLQQRGNFSVPANELDDHPAFEARLAAYVRAAALNKLTDRMDKLGHEVKTLVRIDQDERPGDLLDALLADAGYVADTPEDHLRHARRLEILGRCLRQLTSLARQTIELALRGHTDVEIQQRTGAGSAVAVRRRVSETKNVLMRCALGVSGGMA